MKIHNQPARSSPSGGGGDDRYIVVPDLCGQMTQGFTSAFANIAAVLEPFIHNQQMNDAELASAVLRHELDAPPLTRHELATIACGMVVEKIGDGAFSFADVDQLTAKLSPTGMPIVVPMIYRAIRSLVEKGLIVEVGRGRASRGRLAERYAVTQAGKTAFRLAVTNAYHLNSCRKSDAA